MTTAALATIPAARPPVEVIIPTPARRRYRAAKPDSTPVKLAAIAAGKDILTEILRNPIASVIGGCVVVELCQMIKPDGKHQLLSDFLGGTIETLIVTTGALDAVGKAAGNIKLLQL